MHRLVIVVAAVAVASLAVVGWRSNANDTTCDTTMDFNGVSYTVYEVTEEIVGANEVGVGIERGCGDDADWSNDVAVSRIAGVDPRTALVTPVAAHVLYVAEGVMIDELPSEIAELVAA